MLRRLIATFLVVLWILLAGVDLLEDLEVPAQASLHRTAAGPLVKFRDGANLVNNLIEGAAQPRSFVAGSLHGSGAGLEVPLASFWHRILSLHKLHRVLRI